MTTETIVINSKSNPTEVAKQVNKVRLANKNKWYQVAFLNEETNDKTIIKVYNTWVQLATKPLFDTSMDKKPTEFKEDIADSVSKLI